MAAVGDLTEFLGRVHEVRTGWDDGQDGAALWFRGHGLASWSLNPALYRDPGLPRFELDLHRDFRAAAPAHLPAASRGYFEWLLAMRRGGVPTRLLDWTESPLVALYFAVAAGGRREDGRVWVLDPASLNRQALETPYPVALDHPGLEPYLVTDGPEPIAARVPAALAGPRDTPALHAQRAAFTLHGRWPIGLELIVEQLKKASPRAEVRVERIDVDASRKAAITKELHLAGISAAVLFPGLEGLGRELSYRYSPAFLETGLEAPSRSATTPAPAVEGPAPSVPSASDLGLGFPLDEGELDEAISKLDD